MKQLLIDQMFSTPEQSTPSPADRQIKQGSSQPVNQANSLSENILVGAPPSLPPLGPSLHGGYRCGVGLLGGGAGAGGPPPPLQTVEAVDTVKTVEPNIAT